MNRDDGNSENVGTKHLLENNFSKSDSCHPSQVVSAKEPNNSKGDFMKSFRRSKYRWLALYFGCIYMIGLYFWYDNPNALSDSLIELVTHDGDNSVKYNMLYSFYSYPNIILPLFGGFLIDKVGLNFCIVFFSLLICTGQAIFAVSGWLGTEDKNDDTPFIISLVGRFVFGLGGETLNVSQSVSAMRWFMGRELSTAFGINICSGRLGSVLNNYTMPPIEKSTSLGFALTVGLGLCIFSFLNALWLNCMEAYAQKHDEKHGIPQSFKQDRFKCRDIREFNICFWAITINCVFIYMGIFAFNNISNEFFIKRYGFNQDEAARITSFTFLIAAFLSPIFGFICDKIGNRVSFCFLWSITLTSSHILFYVLPSSKSENKSYLGIIPIVLLGITYSVYVAAQWPMISLVVKPQTAGSAYGLCTSFLNIGLASGPSIVGALSDSSRGPANEFDHAIISLIVFSGWGFVSTIFVYFIDKWIYGGVLQKPAGEENITYTPEVEGEYIEFENDKTEPRNYSMEQPIYEIPKIKAHIARCNTAK